MIFFKYNNLIVLLIILILVLGIFSSYYNLGLLSLFFSVFLPLIFIINVFLGIYGFFKKKYFYLTGVFLFIISFSFFYRISKNDSSNPTDAVGLLSFNVRQFKTFNDADPKKNVPKILKLIDSIKPDILVLQESALIESRKIQGYKYRFIGHRHGVKKTLNIILSNYPIINTGYIDFSNTLNNSLYADLLINQDTIRIYNIHLQSFGAELYTVKDNNAEHASLFAKINHSVNKQIQQAKLVKNEANTCNKKVIICGDFNSTSFSLPYRILKKGLVDSFISKGNGFGTTYSLLQYPLRLDFFLMDKRIEILDHQNFELNLSDHEPILVNFK